MLIFIAVCAIIFIPMFFLGALSDDNATKITKFVGFIILAPFLGPPLLIIWILLLIFKPKSND